MAQINRGTGAGGANTNVNGLRYEGITDLLDRQLAKSPQEPKEPKAFYNIVQFKAQSHIFYAAHQSRFHKSMKQLGFPMTLDAERCITRPAHGCSKPDAAYIHLPTKTIFIIEKKFQQCSGSVCEKIQTGCFKRRHYQKLYPEFRVFYIFSLSDWFRENCAAEIFDLQHEQDIPVFFGNDEKYKDDIVQFMHDKVAEAQSGSLRAD